MTPLARRIMEKVRQKDHVTYERWIGAIVDATLDEAASECEAQVPQDSDDFTRGYRMGCEENASNIRKLKEPAA